MYISEDLSEEDDDVEVGEMLVDGSRGKLHTQSERLRKVRANIEDARRRRREWNVQWQQKKRQEMEEDSMAVSPPVTPKIMPAPESSTKRKGLHLLFLLT